MWKQFLVISLNWTMGSIFLSDASFILFLFFLEQCIYIKPPYTCTHVHLHTHTNAHNLQSRIFTTSDISSGIIHFKNGLFSYLPWQYHSQHDKFIQHLPILIVVLTQSSKTTSSFANLSKTIYAHWFFYYLKKSIIFIFKHLYFIKHGS